MGDVLSIHVGDRVQLRDRPWRVRTYRQLSESVAVTELEALDGEEPGSLSVVVPPDDLIILPNEALRFTPAMLDAFAPWVRAHQILATTLIQETALLSGARFGRVALEVYQLAPTLRVLSRPRPNLLIADDVGLGKTIEAGLATLELLARGRARRVLIVTPPGLLLQWKQELAEKFSLEFTLIENAAGLARAQGELPAGTNPWDALPRVLTSIDFLKKETVRTRALRKRWDLIIVDEAHALAEAGTPQNPYRTQRTRLGHELRKNSRGLVLLTATPHNGYPHSFRSLIELVEPTAATFHGNQEALGRRVHAAMIRRMKLQIVRRSAAGKEEPVFPKRHVRGVPVALQAKELDLLRKVAGYCSRTARSAQGTEDEDLVTFAMQIIKKRALSSRRALEKTIENRLDALRKQEEEARPEPAELRDLQADLPLNEAIAERTALRIVRSAIPKEERRRKAEVSALNGIRRMLRGLPDHDPKIEALLAEVRSILGQNPADKVIVFTEYLDTLEAIRGTFEAADNLSGRTVVLRGGLSGRQRQHIQKKFEEPDTRVLLATDAASEGLNLQQVCHRVIHFELPWNPNRLEQRNGRVDRYGQTRPPEIRYLYYPDSPEDDVLHRLVEKIERIQEAQVSTPDILGVLTGAGEIEHGLVALDPEATDIESQKGSLVRLFEDRTADFVRNVQPLVAAGGTETDETGKILDLLNTTQPLLPDDSRLESVVLEIFGTSAFQTTGMEGVFRIEVPVRYRGPGVQPVYPRATFRRSVAIQHRADDVTFITPLHPLIQSLAVEARRRLLQVYPDERGLPPRRLAARRVPADEPLSAIFTYLGNITGGGGLREERLIAFRVASDHRSVGSPEDTLRFFDSNPAAGEVPRELLSRLFEASFDSMARQASELAQKWLTERSWALQARRHEQANLLRRDLESDLADRLKEIEEEERRALALIDDKTGQARLFTGEDRKASGFQTRRAVAQAQAETRREEIAEYEQVGDSAIPRPLGALFLVPEGLS